MQNPIALFFSAWCPGGRTAQKTFLNFRNSLWMIHKNYQGTPPLLFKVISRMTLDQIAFFRFLAMGKIHNAVSIIKAHFHYYKSIHILKEKRKSIPKKGVQLVMLNSILKIKLKKKR